MTRLFMMLLFTCFSFGFAQFKIGVILSQTGQASGIGQQETKAIQLLSRQYGGQDTFAQNLEIILRDDSSSPQETLDQAKDLIENEGVLALICCTLTTNLKAISEYVNTQSMVTLSPSDLPDSSDWLFGSKPSLERLLQSVILQLSAKGQQSIGVMTIDSRLGSSPGSKSATPKDQELAGFATSSVESALNLLLSPGGMRLAVLERYSPDATVLTPEALWVATRLPETVLVWGLARDSVLAYQALRKRGYEREIVLNPALLSAGSINLLEIEGASFIVSPAQVAETLPETHPSYLTSYHFAGEMSVTGPVSADAAYAYDALSIMKAALEQVLTFGIPTDDTRSLRYALRDALISMPSHTGVAAVYDYDETDHLGIEPLTLVIAKVSQGKLVASP